MESTITPPKKNPTFMENALKRKQSFIQFFLMTGVLMLSLRSVGQKYRIHDLTNDNSELKQEKESLSLLLKTIKEGLLDEAKNDRSGVLMVQLRRLFQEKN